MISADDMRQMILDGAAEEQAERERAEAEAQAPSKSPTETFVDQRLTQAFGTLQAESTGHGMQAVRSAMTAHQDGLRTRTATQRLGSSSIPTSSRTFMTERDWQAQEYERKRRAQKG